jgi:hypothetical protein
MSSERVVTERSYCTRCGWQDPGDTHDWEKHPESIHGYDHDPEE